MLKELLNFGYHTYEQYKKAELARQQVTTLPGTAARSPEPERALPQGEAVPTRKLRVPVSQLRLNLGQETAQLQQMLRKKLAEYGLPSGTQIALKDTGIGTVAVEGRLPPEIREKLEADLNRHPELRRQFVRLSQHQPVVEFVHNAARLQTAYGVDNQALHTLVSRDEGQNSLNDIAQRLQQLRQTTGKSQAPSLLDEKPFELSVSV